MRKCFKALQRRGVELATFFVLLIRFVLERPDGISGWAPTWYALDYSMGSGSRLLIGSLLHLLSPNGVSAAGAQRFASVAILACIALIALLFGRTYRAASDEAKPAAALLIALYAAAPYSVAYLWNAVNFGRLDTYLLLLALAAVLSVNVKRTPVKYALLTALCIVALMVNQVFLFIFFPVAAAAFFVDAFAGYQLNKKRLPLALGAFTLVGAAFLYFQLFSGVRFSSTGAMVAALSAQGDLDISFNALDYEYFRPFLYGVQNHFLPFLRGETPVRYALCELVFLSPAVAALTCLWTGMFRYLRKANVPVFHAPQPYMLLSLLLFLPAFATTVDWNRWLAALFTCQTLMFCALLLARDPAMRASAESLSGVVRRHLPETALALLFLATLETFGARYFPREAVALYGFLRSLALRLIG